MKNTKYRHETLCIYDYRGVEEHLSAMAAKGWQLERTGMLWKYRRAEPADVRYAVTYSDGASQFNPGPTEDQQSLAELCEAAGWEKVCDWFQMQIFCTEDQTAVPLETDDALRLENIHRSMRKNFLPANIVLLVVGLLMSVFFLGTLAVKPLRIFEQGVSLLTGPLFIMLALVEIYTLCHYYGWRRRSRRSIEGGGPCAPINTKAYKHLNLGGLVLVDVLVVLYLLMETFGGGRGLALFYIVYALLLVLVGFLVRRTTALLRNLKATKGFNMLGTLIVDVVLCAILIGGLTYGAIHYGWFFGSNEKETYEYQGWRWDASPVEDLPLTFSDFTGEDYRHVSRIHLSKGSFFIPEHTYAETVLRGDGPEVYSMNYTVWDFKLPWLRDSLVQKYADGSDYSYAVIRYLPEDPAPWGLEEVCRQYRDGDPQDAWLLVWPDRVVILGFTEYSDLPLPDGQKSAIAACLAPKT